MNAAGGRRRDVLAILRDSAEALSINAIAEQLDVHPNTVRFHLEALMESGLVERAVARPARPGRPPQLFVATRGMDPAGPRAYQLLAETLVDSVARSGDPVTHASASGKTMGAELGRPRHDTAQGEPVGQLVELLDELGFAPEPGESRIDLRHCPFLELAQVHPEVVCPVHLGLMQGALEAWNAPVTVERLTPFVEPDLCVAHLSGARS